MRANEQDNQLIWETLKEAEFDMAGQTGLGPLDDKPDPELSRVPPEQSLDKDEGNARKLSVDDFEKELIDLYWTVVDAGIDESMAGDWFDGVRDNLHELLRRHNENDVDLQDLGSKF